MLYMKKFQFGFSSKIEKLQLGPAWDLYRFSGLSLENFSLSTSLVDSLMYLLIFIYNSVFLIMNLHTSK